MDLPTKKLFRVIFQEAHVVDFDFSEWDRQVRLVVVAGLVGKNFKARGPLHNVDFLDVDILEWHSSHLDVVRDSPEHHCQWVIMEFKMRRQEGFYLIDLSGFGPTPAIMVKCRDVKTSELNPRLIDRVNLEWNKPYAPLARRGCEHLDLMLRRHSS